MKEINIFLSRVFSTAFSGLWRNFWTTIFSILALSLIFFLAHISAAGNLIIGNVIQNLEKKVDIAVFIDPNATDLQISFFRNELEKKVSSGEIIKFNEFSKQEALEKFQNELPDETQFLEKYDLENPFLTVFEIIPPNRKVDAENLQDWLFSDEFHGVIDPQSKNSIGRVRISRFLGVTNFLKRTIFSIQILFFSIAFFLIFHAVSVIIRGRNREILIMELMGAKLFFIRLPFILEGFFLGFLALLGSKFLFSIIVKFFQARVAEVLTDLEISFDVQSFSQNFVNIFWQNGIWIVLFSCFTAAAAVEFSLRKKNFSAF